MSLRRRFVVEFFGRVVAFFGLKKSIMALLAMVILVGMGERMAERFLPIYLLALGGSVLAVSLLTGMDNLLSALYSFPGGYLSDRFGYKKALIIFNAVAMLGYLIVIIFPYWPAVIIGSVFFLSWTAISLPATMSMVSRVLPSKKRTMGVTLHSLVRRIPMALGPIVGGTLMDTYGDKNGIRLAFMVAFILGVVALILQQLLIQEDKEGQKAEKSPLRMMRLMSPALRTLLISDILVRFCEQIPYAIVVIWCTKNVGTTNLQFGYLTAIEMSVAMLIYIPVAYFADKSTKKPFVVTTFGFFTLFPLVLSFSKSLGMLILAFIVRGLKEFGEPTRKALIMDLAPEDKKAGMFGAYYLVRDIIVCTSAFAGPLLYFKLSPIVNFSTAFGFGVLGTVIFAVCGKDLKESK